MRRRRLLLVAATAALALTLALVLIGATVLSGPLDRAASSRPTGPAADAGEKARAHLASRLGVSADQITVESITEHTWPDASLDLPEPGMMYAQVLTDGHVVKLTHGDRSYIYHVAGQSVLPADRQEAAPPLGSEPAPDSDAVKRAKADLAGRLSTTPDQISVVSVEAHTWPDASLDLPERGMMYAQVLTDGEVVTLSHSGQTYVYHVSGEVVKLKPGGN